LAGRPPGREIGAYAPGHNTDADRALALLPRIWDFLRQEVDHTDTLADTWARLHDLVGAT
jgi:flagellum-specific ATP synthase